jgi:hypothetical protein
MAPRLRICGCRNRTLGTWFYLLSDFSKEVDTEIYPGKTRYVFMSHHQNSGKTRYVSK